MDRVEQTYRARVEVAERLSEESRHRPVRGVEWVQSYASDVPVLLSRVEELEKENERLTRMLVSLSGIRTDDDYAITSWAKENEPLPERLREAIQPTS